MKKNLFILCSLILILFLFAGCSDNNNNNNNDNETSTEINEESNEESNEVTKEESKEEAITIIYVQPGTEPKSWENVKKKVNEKLLADGVNVQIEHQYIDWAVWEQKLNLMLSTGADMDMFHVMNDVVQISNYIGRGAVKDITAEIDMYGENIKKVIPNDVLDAVTKDGKVFGIPSYWYESSVDGGFTSNDFLLNKYGLNTDPETPMEMLATMEELYNAAPAPKPLFPLSVTNNPVSGTLNRTFESFPFDVRDGIAMINGDGTVKNWIESEEFKQESAFYREAYQKKLINQDVLTLKSDQIQEQVEKVNWPFSGGTISHNQELLDKHLMGAKLDDFTPHKFNPEKGDYRFLNAKNLNAVAANSKHPDAAVKFLNWVYANQDNYDLYLYGIEGETYNKAGDKGIAPILDPDTKQSLAPNVDWMVGNLNYIRVGEIAESGRLLFQPNPNAKSFITAGFFFDASPIKTELGNVKAVLTSDVAPIFAGVVDYDSHIKKATDKLEAAGVDKVIAEYQKQIDAYLAKTE